MRYFLSSLLTFLFLLTLNGCKQDADVVAPEALFGKDWYNTRQQPDGAGFFIYKVQGTYTPQGGWGIDGFRLEKDGAFVLHTQGPADGPLDITGSWKPEGASNYRISLTNGQPSYLLTIELVNDTTLRARQN
ncbi:hypothetical protein Hsw_3273 [Hymenobacter swuensis DY53]|uniref:Lipocalin-like domain-containing protein n=1 Tax=Hymenobacter swuensis DY53 TaxID=1227739 RepID=W8F1S3_9BACT|nr:hypothetical protein Hsw_3273 [Hymenobacter swuensis DY53]